MACRQIDGDNTIISIPTGNENANESPLSASRGAKLCHKTPRISFLYCLYITDTVLDTVRVIYGICFCLQARGLLSRCAVGAAFYAIHLKSW